MTALPFSAFFQTPEGVLAVVSILLALLMLLFALFWR